MAVVLLKPNPFERRQLSDPRLIDSALANDNNSGHARAASIFSRESGCRKAIEPNCSSSIR
jgi:hypothetical protein